jgi:outer membrane protein OmpA-like peptidoglycan-associated protein
LVGKMATTAMAIVSICVSSFIFTGCVNVSKHSVALVLTATSAEPAPALPGQVRQLLEDMASKADQPQGAMVRLIVSGPPGMPQQPEIDLTPYRSPNKVEHSSAKQSKIERNLTDLEHSVAAATASADGLDLVDLLDRAAAGNADQIIVVSSGLSTVAPVDWRQLGWELDPHEVASELAKGKWLPDLHNHRVTFFRLGHVAGSQPQLHLPGRDLVKELWVAICKEAGGTGCETVDDDSALTPPAATRPVPLVVVPPTSTPQPKCSSSTTLDDATLGFRRNSAALHNDADRMLRPYAELLGSCAVADIVGHVADVGPGDDVALSELRAKAVADRLIGLGACPTAIKSVAGRGDTEPLEPNWNPDGTFNETKAARNRRVELHFTATASPCP